jgi:hypothetical protein
MRENMHRAAAFLMLIACGSASPGTVADAASAPADALAADAATPTITLFDGVDLQGWTWVSSDPAVKKEDVFQVAGGAIHCVGAPAGYLRTEAQFTSFVLTLKVRHLKPGNGGVFLRVQPPDKVWPRAIEVQGQSGAIGELWDLEGYPLETDPGRTQGPRVLRLRPEVPERPLGEWNELEIILDGEELRVTVNGTLQNEAHRCAVLPGAIALQSEGAEYEFRDLVLRPLD